MSSHAEIEREANRRVEEFMNWKDSDFHAVIHTATIAAGAGGAIPIPGAGTVAATGAQIVMITSLAKVFGKSLGEGAAKSIFAATAAQYVGRSAASEFAKFIPVFGSIVGAGVAVAGTEALGWGIVKMFKEEYRDKMYECVKSHGIGWKAGQKLLLDQI